MTNPARLEWIGWVATAVFAASYICKGPANLRRVQAVAALLWVAYGLIIHAPPVVAANLVVAVVAVLSARRLDGSAARRLGGSALPGSSIPPLIPRAPRA